MLRILFVTWLLCCSLLLSAQKRYVVRFTDKNGTPYSLSNPSAYLSAKAIQRRSNQGIAIDSTDLPVLQRYIDSVRLAGAVTILNTSKWLNQVAIQTNDAAALNKINSFPFVLATNQVARVNQQSAGNRRDKFAAERALQSVTPANSAGNRVMADYYNYGNSYTQIHIHNGEFLHNIGLRGDNITIAFLDAGYEGYLTNRMFDSARSQGRILGTWDFVANEESVNEDFYHGMSCLSTVAANVPGVMVGTAPNAKFYLYRTEDVFSEFPIEEQNWAAAAERADSLGADMISSSLGYYDFDSASMNHTYADMNGNTTIAAKAGDFAVKKGMIVTNSAGNNGADAYKYIITPADGRYVLAIGATDPAGTIANFSAWGPSYDGRVKPDIASVGAGVYVAATDGNAYPSNGTSFSNPNINGLIACLWQGFPELKSADIIDAVKRSGHKYNSPDDRYGYGIPNVKNALGTLLVQFSSASAAVNNCQAVISWTSKDVAGMKYEIERKGPADANYVKIAELQGQGTWVAHTYQYNASLSGIPAGTVYYRIRQIIDTAAATLTAVYTDTVSVVLASPCDATGINEPLLNANGMLIFPNPINDQQSLTLDIHTAMAVPSLLINIYDTRGSIVASYSRSKPAGRSSFNFNVAGLAKGKYYIQVFDQKKQIGTLQFIRQ
jgi:hypothetical protein